MTNLRALDEAFERMEKHDLEVKTVFVPEGEEGDKVFESLRSFREKVKPHFNAISKIMDKPIK